MHARDERGAALVTTIFVMTMMSAILLGFTALLVTDQRTRFHDRDRTNAFYAAHSGLEKLTNDLGALFGTNFAPTDAEVARWPPPHPCCPACSSWCPATDRATRSRVRPRSSARSRPASGPA